MMRPMPKKPMKKPMPMPKLPKDTIRQAPRMGMAKGGMVQANCGASMKPNRKAKK